MRGPFQGTFQPNLRPTVVTAPDAIVFVNGESDILGCPKCRRKLDFNKFITTIQVNLSVESAPGSASFTLSVPRHSVDDFFFDGQPLITPMMEVEISAKGYFLVEGLPQYYPIFWGLVTEVSDSYSGGEHTVNVSCSDILKWWELCQMNINPAFTQPLGQQGRSLFGNVYAGMNPYDIIWTLAQSSFGDVIVGSGSLLSFYKESTQRATFSTYMGDMMQYWESRFRRMRSNLLLYGARGNAVRGDVISELWNRGSKGNGFVSKLVRRANGGDDGAQMIFDPTDPQVTSQRVQFANAGQISFWQSEFQTKLEIANAAKDCIGYEFYMDVTGDIVYKPPFYNVDVLSNKPISWIQDIDIIDWGLTESESEVVTQLQLSGSYGGNIDYGFGEEMTPATSVTDYHLLRKYGWRTKTFNPEFMGSTIHMFYMGMDLLDQYNAKRFRGSVSIPMRPELRLGFPIYLAPKDQIWYITGISHNIAFGGRAVTSLTLTAKRSKFIAPKGIGTIQLTKYNGSAVSADTLATMTPSTQQLAKSGEFLGDVGDAAQIPPTNYAEKPGDPNPYEPLILRHPKTGRIVGYPNVVMAYTRPFVVPPNEYKKVAGQRDRQTAGRGLAGSPRGEVDESKVVSAQMDEFSRDMQASREKQIANEVSNNRFSYGLTSAGVYTYLYDKTAVIKEMLLTNKQRLKFKDEKTGATENPLVGSDKSSALIRPVSDERGFEVIGHYKYGRNVSLRDGSLVLNETADNPGALNSRAAVSPQLAVSGDLFEVLQAQSQGLVSVYTGYPNPAHTVAKLDPTDTQTAGVVNPNTGEPEFVSVDTNFIDTAPLGSPEQQGVSHKSFASVEASQLSRALTLAELRVMTDTDPSSECGCLMSRSDLAFINMGYQVQVLRTTSSDNTQLDGSIFENEDDFVASQMKDLQDRQKKASQAAKLAGDEAEAKMREAIENDPGTIFGVQRTQEQIEEEVQKARQKATEEVAAEYGLSVEQAEADVVEGDIIENELRPVANTILSREEAISRVETYLTRLYEILDGPHQEYEKVLRGEYISRPYADPSASRFSGSTQDLSGGGVAPPFSPSGRSRGGDVDALAKQGSSAREGLADAWDDFSDDLRANATRASLEGELRQAQKRVEKLQNDIAEREKAIAAGTVVTTQGSDLKSLEEKLAEAEQALLNKQQELSQFNQENPPK